MKTVAKFVVKSVVKSVARGLGPVARIVTRTVARIVPFPGVTFSQDELEADYDENPNEEESQHIEHETQNMSLKQKADLMKVELAKTRRQLKQEKENCEEADKCVKTLQVRLQKRDALVMEHENNERELEEKCDNVARDLREKYGNKKRKLQEKYEDTTRGSGPTHPS